MMFIFAYGSLINLKSASKAIGYELTNSSVLEARLINYRRSWDLVETVYSEKLGKEINAVFLNLTRRLGMYTNGILIPVTEKQLYSISSREKNYNMIEVSSEICLSHSSYTKKIKLKKVFTAVAKNEYKTSSLYNQEVYFLKEYDSLVKKGVENFGKLFLENYLNTTDDSVFEIIEGTYKFVDPLQNSLA